MIYYQLQFVIRSVLHFLGGVIFLPDELAYMLSKTLMYGQPCHLILNGVVITACWTYLNGELFCFLGGNLNFCSSLLSGFVGVF